LRRRPKTIISTRIEANKDKIYRASDVYDLAYLVFPNKNAVDLRAGFILIFIAIKYAQNCAITTIELETIRNEKASAISPKSLWKARAAMSRIGLITKREGLWQFSTKFTKSLCNLADKTDGLMISSRDRDTQEKEWHLLNYAKACLKNQDKNCGSN
jgi:hypothetical protein